MKAGTMDQEWYYVLSTSSKFPHYTVTYKIESIKPDIERFTINSNGHYCVFQNKTVIDTDVTFDDISKLKRDFL